MNSKFVKLKNELNELGYFESFSLESIPLVDRLFGDLKTTTESLQKYMKISQKAIEEKNNLEFGAEPYKCDNAKLIKECNDLHLAFIQFKEKHEKIQKDSKRQLRILEQEKEESELQQQKLKARINSLEIDLVDQGHIISSIKGKKPTTGVSTNTDLKTTSLSSTSVMPVMNKKISFLTNEIKELKQQKLQLLENIEFYEKQLINRDLEIKRLNSLLEGGRSINALRKDFCNKHMDNKYGGLQEQITTLKEEKKTLENNLKETLAKQHEAMRRALHLAERNKQLEKELKDIDQIALVVEAECNSAVKDKTEKVSRLQDRVNESLIRIQSLERENAKLKQDKLELCAELDAIQIEKRNLQKLLERECEDRKRMFDKINKFTIIENDLNLEIDRLVRLSAEQKRTIAELESQISVQKLKQFSQETQLNAFENKEHITEKDNNVRQKHKVTSKYSRKEHKPTCKNSVSQELIEKSSGHCGNESCIKHLKGLLDKEIEQRQLQATQVIESLKQEKEYYMKEYQKLMEQLQNKPENSDKYVELIKKINEHETNVENLKQENKILSQEKFLLMKNLDSARNLHDSDYQEICNNPLYKRKEREIELLRADLIKLEDEREIYRKKTQDHINQAEHEKERIKAAFKEMEEHINKLENERRDLAIHQGSQKTSITYLEDQCESLKNQLRTTQDELNILKASYNQLKTVHDHLDRTLSDTQRQLLEAENELANYKQKVKSSDMKSSARDSEISTLNGDINILKVQLTKLDKEKDDLLIELDNKTEKIAALEDQLKMRAKVVSQLEDEKNRLKTQLSRYEEETYSKETEIKSSRHEISSLQEELENERKLKESSLKENKRLQDTLASVTCDCRDARAELDQVFRQVDDLKRQLQIYVAEIKRTEDLISHKEIERNELLDQFKSLSQEAVALETNNHTLETEANQSRIQLSVALDHASDLESKLEDQQSIIKSYEKQITDLTGQVASFEIQVKQNNDQYERAIEDMKQMRELCVKLDQEKDILQRELLRKDEERLKVQRSLDKIRNDNDSLQNRLGNNRENVEGLEKLLNEARQEIIEQRLQNQNLESEVERLKMKIGDGQERLATATEQLDIYQEKALEYSQQIKTLRREIANERFFRAREEDNKRYPSL